MKPIRLKMQAFGPYATEAIIDFRLVKDGGLFLIHGQTGAGKTSILDGLCFSLFGKSSGDERSPEGMRCDLAKPELPTEVSLEFSLGREIYRVVRRPKQVLKKQRGDGVTTSQPKGDLYKLKRETDKNSGPDALDNGTWDLITSGDKKTDSKITELLGMSEEQFRQVVVLPQGKFRNFLASGSDDREELLESLFRTSRYRILSDRLASKSDALLKLIAEKRKSIESFLASMNVEDTTSLESKISASRNRLEVLAVGESDLESRYLACEKRRNIARNASQNKRQLVSLEEKLDALQTKREDIENIASRLDGNLKVRPIVIAQNSIRNLERDISRLNEQLRLEDNRLKEANQELERLRSEKTKLEAQKPEIDQLRTEQENLREVWKRANEFQSEKEKARAADDVLKVTEKKTEELEHRVNTLKVKKAALLEDITKFQSIQSKLGSLLSERKLLQSDLTALEENLNLATEKRILLEKLEIESSATQNQLANESRKLQKIKIDYHLAQAALLARDLKSGLPCPVCGSQDHPQPAIASENLATWEDVEKAEHAYRLAAEKASSAKTKIESSKEQLASILERMGKLTNASSEIPILAKERVEKLKAEIAAMAISITAAEKAGHEMESLRRTLKVTDEEIVKTETEFSNSLKDREEKRSAFEAAKARVLQLSEILPEKMRDLETIKSRGVALKEKLEAFNNQLMDVNRFTEVSLQARSASEANLKTFASEIKTKRAELASLAADIDVLLEKSGFMNLELALQAHLDESEVKKLETEKRLFDDDYAFVSTRLSELRQEASSFPEWAFDLESREKEFLEVDQERSNKKGEKISLLAEIESLNQNSERIKKAIQDLAKSEEEYKVVGKLAGVANGQGSFNLSKVNFPRYVLATRLDEVLEQASRRLFQMSRGQFILKRSQTVEDKRKNAGLDLEVEDSFTGSSRPTASLSGGEGFLASLSLALGLADVVQSQLGGVRLEAVFVDEGFGSLDAEALELAMKTLGELQAGGRLVGVISHVPEMREQIARRLVVRKTAHGSGVQWDLSSTMTP